MLENLPTDTLPRLLRRTTLSAIIVGVVGFAVAVIVAPPLAALGVVIGVTMAILNLRFLDGQTAAGKISGDDNEAARRCNVGFGAVRESRWSNMDRGQDPGGQGGKNDEYSLRSFYDAYKHYMGESLISA